MKLARDEGDPNAPVIVSVFTSELKCDYVLNLSWGLPPPYPRLLGGGYVPAPYLLKYYQKLISRDGSESMVGERASWFVRRETHKCAGDEPRNGGSKQSLHQMQKRIAGVYVETVRKLILMPDG